jgi:AcrR family transcriptional regulator
VARTVGSAAEDTRRRILDTATELFNERGYARTSIRDIAEHIGMTKGSLYYHFASKDELLYAIIAPFVEAITKFLGAVHDAGTVSAELVRELVDMLDAHAPLVRSLTIDPAVIRAKLQGRGVTAQFTELERTISGSMDEAAMLRGRCALGLIHTGVLGPPRPDPRDQSHDRCATVRRLTEAEKVFITTAALAVLAVPVPSD